MIAINFTIFVELGLFLLFMWVTQRLILMPLLAVMDRRDDRVTEDEQAAEQRAAEAESLESRYADEIAAMRRAASTQIEQARREGMMARALAIRERKAEADQAVRVVEEAAMGAMETERQQFGALVPGLTERMAKQLHLGIES